MTLNPEAAHKLLTAWRNDPILYFKDVLGVQHTWEMQEQLLKACPRAIKEHKHIYVASGHCFGRGTKILMSDGSIKNVEDISCDDKIMGDDSKERTVLSTCNGMDDLYRVEYYDGTKYIHNGSHILCLSAMSDMGKIKKNSITEIELNDYRKLPDKNKRRLAGFRSGVNYSEKIQEIPAYIFGLWLGDGCHSSPDFANIDKKIIDELEIYCNRIGCDFIRRSNGRNLYFRSRGKNRERNIYMELLKSIGVFKNKHIPQHYLCGSKEQRLELLAGLIDSDGSKHKEGGYEITQKRKILAKQIVILARSLGMFASIRSRSVSVEFKSGHKKSGEYWRVYIGSSNTHIPCRLDRKIENNVRLSRHHLRTGIKSVTPLGRGEYFGFTIDGNQRFLGADFMVLHNSLGKDWLGGGVGLWFLHCFSPSIVILTAPTDRQVKKVMWGETMSHWRNKKMDLGGKPFTDPYLEIRKEDWYLLGFTTKETGASSDGGGGKFQGFHAPSVCVIVTEAQAVEDAIFDQIDAVTTNENVLVIFLGNPTRAGGRFAKGLRNKEDNIVFNFSCLDNPNYKNRATIIPGLCSYEWVEDKRKKWGENDPRWAGRVLGQIPEHSINNVFPQLLVNQGITTTDCFGLSHNNGVAMDVAGEGVDDNVIMGGRKGIVFDTKAKNKSTPSENALDCLNMCKGVDGNFIIIDCDGLGIGTWQELNKIPDITDKFHILKFHGSSRFAKDPSKNPDNYENVRSKACFIAQKRLKNGEASIPNIPELIEELLEIKFFENSRGLLQIEDNDDIKERLGRSPDHAMAWIMYQYATDMKLDKKIMYSNKNDAYGYGGSGYSFNPATV